MAEIVPNERKSKRLSFQRKGKKISTRVDLTPMVDLGFLLITFFVFTTTVSQSTSLNLNMPKDTNMMQTNVPQSGSLTLLLGNDDELHYYFGMDTDQMKQSNYRDIRNVILDKKKNTPPEKLFVIIKPAGDASYKNIVDVLDEMNIDDIPRYAVTDPSARELALLTRM